MPGKAPVWVIHAGAVYLDCPDDVGLQRTGGHMVFPDERVAVVALTNQNSVDASAAIARKIAPAPALRARRCQQRRTAIPRRLRRVVTGQDQPLAVYRQREQLLTEQTLQDFASSLGPLGAPQEYSQTTRQERGGMTFRLFEALSAADLGNLGTHHVGWKDRAVSGGGQRLVFICVPD